MALSALGVCTQVRTNFTILPEPGYEEFPLFFKEHQVHLVGSLPCYLEDNVDAQRGAGVYQKSIEAIKRLNALGYGSVADLPLNLVYNPIGPQLPPDQSSLESAYRQELDKRFGIVFTRLLTITNIPIGRFLKTLQATNQDRAYMDTLEQNFNAKTLDNLMCRHQVTIAWDGSLHDCDFNYALGYPMHPNASSSLNDVDVAAVINRCIVTGNHCFGCTAGCGSSCGGALI
jgi:radical SAM/Cys-rich protein